MAPPRSASTTRRYALLTVDVWDTLLRRRCHPDAVKLHVARVLVLCQGGNLPLENHEFWRLLRLRQQAEKEIGDARRSEGFDDEYGHREVYARWLELAGFSGNEVDRNELIDALERAELDQERHVTYADPRIAETLGAHVAERTMFLSDFYMPAGHLRPLLASKGLGSFAAEGLVSCEVGLNKRSGRLYRHLHESLCIAPDTHLHVGDNPHADIAAARAAGIETQHYKPADEHARREAREAGFADREGFLRAAAGELVATTPAPAGIDATIHAYGLRCSPLFVGYVLDIMERAAVRGAKRVFFFTREGEFFGELYRRLATSNMLGTPVPDAALLEVSRLATFSASLGACSTDELMRMWNQYSVQSLRAMLVSLGIDANAFAGHATRCGIDIDIDEPITWPWQDERVRRFLDDAIAKGMLDDHLRQRREALLAYLHAAGAPTARGSMEIADIGWRGTIQDNLAHLLPDVTIHGHYLGLNRYLNAQPRNALKHAFGPDLNTSDTLADLIDFVAPIEMLSNSPNGSVVGYRQQDGTMRAMREADAAENAVFDACSRHFQRGVLDSAAYWADFLRTHAYTADELRPPALQIWRDIIAAPPPFLAHAYFRLNHNETFGVGGYADKRARPPAATFVLALVSRSRRRQAREFLKHCGWIPGLLAASSASPAFRAAVRLYLTASRTARRMMRVREGLRGVGQR